jgi:hypothetical protein
VEGLDQLQQGFYFVTQDIKATMVNSQMGAEAFEALTKVYV